MQGGACCEDIPRKPDSSATEKHDFSALKDAERTKGPVSESRMGLVFILNDCVRKRLGGNGPGAPEGSYSV